MPSPRPRLLACASLLGTLAGCSSILSGTSQDVLVNTNPAGADCGLYREGIRIATIQGTPGSARVQKTKHPIWVVCAKPGSEVATLFNKSGTEGATLGNILLGGGIGWAIDSAAGADNKYDSPVNLTLLPASGPANPAHTSGVAMLPSTFAAPAPAESTPTTAAAAPVSPGQPAPSANAAAANAAAANAPTANAPTANAPTATAASQTTATRNLLLQPTSAPAIPPAGSPPKP